MGITAFPFSSVIDVPTARILGRDDAGTGAAEALTAAEVLALLSVYTTAQVDSLLAGKSNVGHTHDASAITSGTLDIARIPLGTTSATVCVGNDARLSDARTPLAHTHAAADITSGIISTARLATGAASASTYLRGDQTWAAVSAGISSLNGLTNANQTFAVGASGTDVAFVSAAGVHTLNIPDASLSARGVINTGSQNIQGVKSFYAGIDAAYVNLFSWWGLGDGANGGVQFFSGHGIAWGSAAFGAPVRNSLSGDVQLRRDTAGRLGQRSGLTAQASGVYNRFTSDTSFERLDIAWANDVCTIAVTAGSAGGTLRGLRIGGASTSLLAFYGATPVDRPDTIADPTGGGTIDAEARTAINTIIDRLQELGLIA